MTSYIGTTRLLHDVHDRDDVDGGDGDDVDVHIYSDEIRDITHYNHIVVCIN